MRPRHRRLAAFWGLSGLLFTASGSARASSPEALFERANASYDAQSYAQAAADYEELIARGLDSGWVHFNLGNAYLRQQKLGRAIAAYVRSEARLPRHPDVKANLQFARRRARDALAPPEPSTLRRLFWWHDSLSYHELVYVTATINGLFWLCCGVAAWTRRRAPWPLLAVISGVMLLAVATSLSLRSAWPRDVMVVLNPEIEVHSGTSYDTMVRFRLHEGTQGRVVDSDQAWLRIELSDGKQGWVAAGDVLRLSLL